MSRTILLTAVAGIVLAALFHGIVLNGFGLFAPVRQPATVTAAAPETVPAQDATPAAPPPAADAPAEPVATATSPSPAGEPAAPSEGGASDALPDPARVARNVTPPNVLSRPTSRYREPAPETAEEKEEPSPVRRYHRVVVRDAARLEAGEVTIRFAGIAPIDGDRSCTDAGGQSWPCGKVAAAALRMLIRHRAIDCTVASETADGILATCSVALQDINGWLVDQGWAEASPDTGYAEAAEAARNAGRGIYLARWEAKGGGGTGSVPEEAFTAPAIPPEGSSTVPVAVPLESPVN